MPSGIAHSGFARDLDKAQPFIKRPRRLVPVPDDQGGAGGHGLDQHPANTHAPEGRAHRDGVYQHPPARQIFQLLDRLHHGWQILPRLGVQRQRPAHQHARRLAIPFRNHRIAPRKPATITQGMADAERPRIALTRRIRQKRPCGHGQAVTGHIDQLDHQSGIVRRGRTQVDHAANLKAPLATGAIAGDEAGMNRTPDILCIGSILWDIIGRSSSAMRLGSDVPGRITRLPGGVAMNIAMTLARFGMRPAILTTIGRDAEGDELLAACQRLGLITDYAYRSDDLPTDRYMAIEGANGLIAAIADAHSLEAAGDKILRPLADGGLASAQSPWAGPIALDGNLTTALLADIAQSPLFARADLRVAPASPGKAERLLPLLTHPGATLYVNLEEANLLSRAHAATAPEAAEALLARGAGRVLVTDGGRMAAEATRGQGVITGQPPHVLVARVTGAGDTFMAAHIVAERAGRDRISALNAALQAAATYVSGEVGT